MLQRTCVTILMLCRMFIFMVLEVMSTVIYMCLTSNERLKQSLLYMDPVIWNNLPSFLKSASSVDGFKTLYKRLLRK